MGGKKWALLMFPHGSSEAKDKSFSLFLQLDSSEKLKPGEKIDVRFKLRVLDQNGSDHTEKSVEHWFHESSRNWGFPDFVSLADLRDASKGFVVKYTFKVEVEFEALSEIIYFPK